MDLSLINSNGIINVDKVRKAMADAVAGSPDLRAYLLAQALENSYLKVTKRDDGTLKGRVRDHDNVLYSEGQRAVYRHLLTLGNVLKESEIPNDNSKTSRTTR